MTAGSWLYPEDPGDYGTGGGFLWVDPMVVVDALGLDPGNPDDVALATELDAEASLVLDAALDYRFGPARCVAATYRVRAQPILKMAPPIGTVHGVVLHHESCLPPDNVYEPDLEDVGTQALSRIFVMTMMAQGTSVPTPLAVIPGEGGADGVTGGVSYCVDTPTTLRMCGLGGMSLPWPTAGMPWSTGMSCGPSCTGGSSLITVLYKSRANWPPGLSRIFMTLVKDLYASTLGSSAAATGACDVPPNTTSVSRQGVSWTTDPNAEQQVAGITGIRSVDRWIARHQSKIRMTDPVHATLLFRQYYDCNAATPYTLNVTSPFAAEFAASVDDVATVDPLVGATP